MYRVHKIISWEYYHIFNRWFNRNNIFYNYDDYIRFLKTIIKYQTEFSFIKLYSFSLMPNHFHFLLKDESDTELSNIPDFMRKVQNSYAKYFNMKYQKKWQVFEWRYKANYIDTDEYMYNILVYINCNPLKHWIVKDINEWSYTSYHYLMSWIISDSTPVLNKDIYSDISFKDLYNKYLNNKLTPVLEYE